MALTQRQVRDPKKLAPIIDGIINDSAIKELAGITGLVKAANGVASAAVADTDYLKPGALTDEVVITLESGESITFTIVKGLITGIDYDDGKGEG
jgi:hypothetical protein